MAPGWLFKAGECQNRVIVRNRRLVFFAYMIHHVNNAVVYEYETPGVGKVPGQIVIVNGTSGSGKSTACDLFAKRAKDFWLVYGIDHFLGSTYPRTFGHGGERSKEGIHAHPVNPAEPEGNWRWSISD